MSMEPVFGVYLEGQLDQPNLEYLRKLLNLTPHGRLTDTEDAEFGERLLTGSGDSRVDLTLWRGDDQRHWLLKATALGLRPTADQLARWQGEVLGAVAAVGLTVTTVQPPPPGPIGATRLRLPTQRAFSALLQADEGPATLSVEAGETLQRLLLLAREFGGPTRTERGWRYVRWDPPGQSILLQLFETPDANPEVALLFEGQPPTPEMVAGCRLEVAVAASVAGLAVLRLWPEAPVPVDDWAGLAGRATSVTALAGMWPLLGVTAATSYDMVRGRLLAVKHQREWAGVPAQLQREVDEFLLGTTPTP